MRSDPTVMCLMLARIEALLEGWHNEGVERSRMAGEMFDLNEAPDYSNGYWTGMSEGKRQRRDQLRAVLKEVSE